MLRITPSDSSNNAFYHDPVAVNVGDTLVGVMTLTGQSDGLFSYDCVFQQIGGTRLIVNNIPELTVATETLECYVISECKNYPNARLTAMTGIEMKTGGIDVSPAWRIQNRVTDCGQRTVIVNSASPGGEVDLYYGGSPNFTIGRDTSVAGLSRNPNQMDLFAVGEDGGLHSEWWNGEWREWFTLAGAGYFPGTPVTALSRNPNQMDLFVLGMDGVIRSIYWNGHWSGWFALGGAGFNQGNPITALSRNPNQMDLFVLGMDGVIRSIYWNGNWSGWFALDGAGFNQGNPITALSRNPNQIDVFVVGMDGGVYSTWWNGSWNAWFRIGSGVFPQGTSITALSRNPNQMDLFAVGIDGAVYSAWWNGVWHDWFLVV
jgi:hypothetical protein